ARPASLEKIAVAPINLRARIAEGIEAEIKNSRAGKPAQIWAKLNALVDPAIIDLLYKAAEAGVSIDLVVRGICCLRPGVPGMSETIRVRSIIGRFLEPGRIVCFADANRPARRGLAPRPGAAGRALRSPGRMPDRHATAPVGRIAVVDVGSNSLRLVVFERLGASLLPLLNEKVMCALGRGIARTGRLNPD